jgi:hypothetical protein
MSPTLLTRIRRQLVLLALSALDIIPGAAQEPAGQKIHVRISARPGDVIRYRVASRDTADLIGGDGKTEEERRGYLMMLAMGGTVRFGRGEFEQRMECTAVFPDGRSTWALTIDGFHIVGVMPGVATFEFDSRQRTAHVQPDTLRHGGLLPTPAQLDSVDRELSAQLRPLFDAVAAMRLSLTLSPSGQLLTLGGFDALLRELAGMDTASAAPIPASAGLLADEAALRRLVPGWPDAGVALGETWQRLDTIALSGLPRFEVTTRTTLDSATADLAFLHSTLRTDIDLARALREKYLAEGVELDSVALERALRGKAMQVSSSSHLAISRGDGMMFSEQSTAQVIVDLGEQAEGLRVVQYSYQTLERLPARVISAAMLRSEPRGTEPASVASSR